MDRSIKLKLTVIFAIRCQTFNEILVKHFHFVKSGKVFLTKKKNQLSSGKFSSFSECYATLLAKEAQYGLFIFILIQGVRINYQKFH